ncbi:DMT family protein [Devosia sp.]|uniref:DMT family protein n=1 Tax=Devosia sp. TaxID=1871048 RepID=UPI001AC7156A|nr:DMT family protein [Devosia sp.]MBN9365363.1 DMT family protein [Devosia sp.]
MPFTFQTVMPILLLIGSNVFMTIAWYGHLKFPSMAMWAAELKTIQEVISLTVFAGFAVFVLGEKLTWNHAVGFGLIFVGAFFIFRGPLK